MAQFTKNNKRNPLERSSSQGLVLGCPICAAKLDLLDTRDGDQAYWCHRCQSGWRVGNLPEAAHRSKDKQGINLEPPVETPAPAEPAITPKARGSKIELAAPDAAPSSPRANAKLPVQPAAQLVSPKRRASPRAAEVAVSTPKTASPKTTPKEAQKKPLLETSRKDSSRAAQILRPVSEPVKAKRQRLEEFAAPAARSPRTDVQRSQQKLPEIAASMPQPKRRKHSPLETPAPIKASTPRAKRPQPEQPALVISGKGSRKPAAPAPEAATGKRQRPQVATAPKLSARAGPQKLTKKTLETAAPKEAPFSPAKPSRREQPIFETSKGARKPVQVAAPSPKAATGKRQPLEVVTAPKISARATAQIPQKKTLETVAQVKAPARPAKPSRREQPVLEIKSVAPQRTRQRSPPVELTPKPRRASARVAEAPAKAGFSPSSPKGERVSAANALDLERQRQLATLAPLTRLRRPLPLSGEAKKHFRGRSTEDLKPARVVPEQRESRNPPIDKAQTAPIRKAKTAPVSQARAQRPTAPLESKSRRAARVAATPSPAPVKSPKPVKPEPTRAARVAKQPAAVAPRPKPARSSPARPVTVAPSNPVQFGLFDALPPKSAGRRSVK